jgi:hypothetical protein
LWTAEAPSTQRGRAASKDRKSGFTAEAPSTQRNPFVEKLSELSVLRVSVVSFQFHRSLRTISAIALQNFLYLKFGLGALSVSAV